MGQPPPALAGPDELRALFASTPSPVAVVTALDRTNSPTGATCNSVVSVALRPPTLLVCLGHGSRTLAGIVHHGHFAVNFLAADGGALATRFASDRTDKFASVPYEAGPHGTDAPVLSEAVVGWARCAVLCPPIIAGDHSVVFGRLMHTRTFGRAPLLYYRREFHGWTSPA